MSAMGIAAEIVGWLGAVLLMAAIAVGVLIRAPPPQLQTWHPPPAWFART